MRRSARPRAPRKPRVAHRKPVPVARRAWSVPHRSRALSSRARHRLGPALPCRANAPRRRRRDPFALAEPRVRDAQAQGCGLRPLPRSGRSPAVDRQAAPRRPRPCLPDGSRRDDLSRHVGRAAVQARLAARGRRSAAPRESRGRRHRPHRLDARHAVPRSHVRQRHDRHRGRDACGGSGAGARAHVRLPEARVVRRSHVAAPPPARPRPRPGRAWHACGFRERS